MQAKSLKKLYFSKFSVNESLLYSRFGLLNSI